MNEYINRSKLQKHISALIKASEKVCESCVNMDSENAFYYLAKLNARRDLKDFIDNFPVVDIESIVKSFDGVPEQQDKKVTRADIIDEAKKCVCEDRESQYGSPEDSFTKIARFWSDYLEFPISPVDVGIMMNLFKVARIKNGRFKSDSYIDACGYLACAGEIAGRGENNDKD